ncbi:MAG TPA: hypothetical protein VK737_03890, partial [Opitutales bacterium]|nr:hypothetical protein [Opitutales bacterium]
MKARILQLFLRAAFILGAVAAAYLIGLSQRVLQTDIMAVAKEKTAESERIAAKLAASAPKQAPVMLTRDEAWAQIEDYIHDQHRKIDDALDFMDNINADDIPYLLKQVIGLPLDPRRNRMIEALLDDGKNGLAERDPVGALRLVMQITQPGVRDKFVDDVFNDLPMNTDYKALLEMLDDLTGPPSAEIAKKIVEYWAASDDIANAAAYAAALPTGTARNAALKIVAERWAEDPDTTAAALTWAEGLPLEDSAVLKTVLSSVIDANITLAMQSVDQISDSAIRQDIIVQIAQAMGEGAHGRPPDPADAMDWLNQIATGDTYDKAVKAIIADSPLVDPKLDLLILDKVTEPSLRTELIGDIAESLNPPQTALDWAQTLPEADRTNAQNKIIANWATQDPNAVIAYAQNSGDPTMLLSNASAIAAALLKTQPAPYSSAVVDGFTYNSIAPTNANTALSFVQNLPDGATKNKALDTTLSTLADSGNDGVATVLNYVSSVPTDDNIVSLLGNIVENLSYDEPTKAAEFLAQVPAGPAQTSVASALMASWSQQDPQGFATWANGLPEGAEHDEAMAQLSSEQAATNPAAALALAQGIADPQAQAAQVQAVQLASQINALPLGDERDTAITQLVAAQIQQDPADAILWANTISNPQVRLAQLQQIIQAWAIKGAGALYHAIDS